MLVCSLCGSEIENENDCWHEVTGWEKERTQGGANALFSRKRSGRVMCRGCYEKQRNTGMAEQQDLFSVKV